jgi:hypothetical protein
MDVRERRIQLAPESGCMVFIASGRLSTRWAMWPVVARVKQLREGGVGAFMPPL